MCQQQPAWIPTTLTCIQGHHHTQLAPVGGFVSPSITPAWARKRAFPRESFLKQFHSQVNEPESVSAKCNHGGQLKNEHG